MSEEIHYKKLYRSTENRIVAGVCGGIAEYFETDPILVRIIFIFISLIGAAGILLYIILWFMIPEKNSEQKKHEEFVHEVKNHIQKNHHAARGVVGFFIILIGVLLLIDQFYPDLGFSKFWPILVIAFGAVIILKTENKPR